MKIAIVRLSALGDIIVSASFVACLKELFPQARIDWFVDERFVGILEHSSVIDNLCVLPLKRYLKSWNLIGLVRCVLKFRAETYDYVIDMQGLLKSALLGKLLKSRYFCGFDNDSARECLAGYLYEHGTKIAYEDSIMERNARVLFDALPVDENFQKFFWRAVSARGEMFGYTQEHANSVNALLFDSKKHVLFILEASLVSKTYSAENFIALGRALARSGAGEHGGWGAKRGGREDIAVLLLCYQDTQKAEGIYEELKGVLPVKILPKMDLNLIKALMARMDLAIGGDTGITHLAWAMQRPSITLYGNTPLARFQLKGAKNFALSGNPNASYDKNDHSINAIAPEEIAKRAREIL